MPTKHKRAPLTTVYTWRCEQCGRICARLNFLPPTGGKVEHKCKCNYVNELSSGDARAIDARGRTVYNHG